MLRPPLPPFTAETTAQKVRMAEDGWKGRNLQAVSLAYSEDSRWRNRAEFRQGESARKYHWPLGRRAGRPSGLERVGPVMRAGIVRAYRRWRTDGRLRPGCDSRARCGDHRPGWHGSVDRAGRGLLPLRQRRLAHAGADPCGPGQLRYVCDGLRAHPGTDQRAVAAGRARGDGR